MGFSAGVNSGIAAGQAAFGPLAQALDPLRGLQTKSLKLAIEEQKQGIDFYNKFFGQLGSDAAQGNPEAQEALSEMSRLRDRRAGRSFGLGGLGPQLAGIQQDVFGALGGDAFVGPVQRGQGAPGPQGSLPQPQGALPPGQAERIDRLLQGAEFSGLTDDQRSAVRQHEVSRTLERLAYNKAAPGLRAEANLPASSIPGLAGQQQELFRSLVRSNLSALVPNELISALNGTQIEQLIDDLIQSGQASKLLPSSSAPRTGVSEPLVNYPRANSVSDLLQRRAAEPFVPNLP